MFTWSDSACWILVIVLALTIEAFTLNLSAIWFAVGGVGSLIATTLQCSVPVQWIVFLVVSGVSLVLARPMAVKLIGTKRTATNADRILGEQAIVTQTISNTSAQGEIKIMGQYWTARSADGSEIPEGALVRVLEIVGVKAIVEPIETAVRKEG
ncbi:MAG: NfeD family protein [Butyricicoccus pullicaecorum]|nr:NfeD family protein [Butyricicoccus pullicaecorum]